MWNSVENVSYGLNLDVYCLYYLRAGKPYSLLCLGYGMRNRENAVRFSVGAKDISL